MKIVGSFVSPYVRKVLACLELKGLPYEVDPITPFFGGDEFERLSPLRRIPVMIDGALAISDSSVICAYLDEAYPDCPLLPASPAERARARWFEEYADSRLGDVFIWGLFYPRFVHRAVWGEEGDLARAEASLQREIPRELDYLETQLPAQGTLFETLGLADIAIASFFRNAFYVGFTIDEERWPRTAAYVERVLAEPAFETLKRYEDISRSTDIRGRRDALIEAGVRLAPETLGTREPRRGVMRL